MDNERSSRSTTNRNQPDSPRNKIYVLDFEISTLTCNEIISFTSPQKNWHINTKKYETWDVVHVKNYQLDHYPKGNNVIKDI